MKYLSAHSIPTLNVARAVYKFIVNHNCPMFRISGRIQLRLAALLPTSGYAKIPTLAFPTLFSYPSSYPPSFKPVRDRFT